MPTPNPVDPRKVLVLPSFRSLYLLTSIVGLLVAADILLWWFGYEDLRSPLGINLSLLAALLGGARFVYGAIAAMFEGDVGADLALAIAMVAALLLGEYWVAAEVVLIAMVGESLEAITFSRTHRELRKILELQPRTVRVRRQDRTIEVALEQVRVGDIVLVRPGERIPVDGSVAVGRSSVDQSTLTGESLPIDKGQDDPVYAGTMNQFGALEVRVEKVGQETTLGKVIRLVAEARQNKAEVERVADRLARYFLPFVLTLAAGTFVYTNFSALAGLVTGIAAPSPPWIWMPTLAVLVVTCPCALILATPAAMMAALAWLARRGVLTTGGAALERLATVTRFAFDKTGTLTEGRLQLGEIVAVGGHDQRDVLRWAATAEQSSEHLIAQTIVQAASDQEISLEMLERFEALPGAGVLARLPGTQADSRGHELLVGNRRLMAERNVPISNEVEDAIQRLDQAAQTPLLVTLDQQIIGLVGVRDTIRSEAACVIGQLRELGINEIVLLTGDRPAAARQVAHAVGIDRFEAELRPEEKAAWIVRWGEPPTADRVASTDELQRVGDRSSAARSPLGVAMVGDGVNDAPALARADVGLALGGVGSDIAAEAGDLILMGDPLTPLPGLVRLSRETVRIIRQNIVLFAFFVNVLGIVLTAWIMPTWSDAWMARSPVAAALFHQVGSLLVLLNAMRLLWFERWHQGRLGRLETRLASVAARWTARLTPGLVWGKWFWQFRGQLLRVGLMLLLAAYLTQIVVFVQPDEVAVVQRFGRFHAALPPGPHLRLPPPWDWVTREQPARVRTVELGLRRVAEGSSEAADASGPTAPPVEWNTEHQQGILQLAANEALMLTGDQSLVELAITVQYRITDLLAYRFGVRDADRVLEAVSENVTRQVIASEPLLTDDGDIRATTDILTTGRGMLETRIRDELQQRVDTLGLGIEILPEGVCFQDVHPPLDVVSAFRDVSSAFKEKERMRNEADAYHREKVITAAGQAIWRELSTMSDELNDERLVQLWNTSHATLAGEIVTELNAARAFAAEQEHLATGDAASFQVKEAAHSTEPALTEWRMFVDAMRDALSGKRKLILDGETTGRRHLMLGFPNDSPAQLLPPINSNLLEDPE